MKEHKEFAEELNRLSASHPIGSLQEIRQKLKKLSRPAAKSIFTAQSINNKYAFHLGGRRELQFNIGWDTDLEVPLFRHGVAFSLETSRSLPSIIELIPKIVRFNEFVRVHPNEFDRFRMWHVDHGKRSRDYGVGEIPEELAKPQVFIFLGHLTPTGVSDPEQVLADFDHLLSLYRFVEGCKEFPSIPMKPGFRFAPGCSTKPSSTQASLSEQKLDISLRHNTIQLGLHAFLAKKHGSACVGTEIPSGADTRIDVVLEHGSRL